MDKARESARTKAMKIIQTAALSGDWRAAAELLKLTFPADYRNSSRIDVTAIAQISPVTVTEEERQRRIELRNKMMAVRLELDRAKAEEPKPTQPPSGFDREAEEARQREALERFANMDRETNGYGQ